MSLYSPTAFYPTETSSDWLGIWVDICGFRGISLHLSPCYSTPLGPRMHRVIWPISTTCQAEATEDRRGQSPRMRPRSESNTGLSLETMWRVLEVHVSALLPFKQSRLCVSRHCFPLHHFNGKLISSSVLNYRTNNTDGRHFTLTSELLCSPRICRKLRQNDERCRALPELINEVFVLLKHDLDLCEDDALVQTVKKNRSKG